MAGGLGHTQPSGRRTKFYGTSCRPLVERGPQLAPAASAYPASVAGKAGPVCRQGARCAVRAPGVPSGRTGVAAVRARRVRPPLNQGPPGWQHRSVGKRGVPDSSSWANQRRRWPGVLFLGEPAAAVAGWCCRRPYWRRTAAACQRQLLARQGPLLGRPEDAKLACAGHANTRICQPAYSMACHTAADWVAKLTAESWKATPARLALVARAGLCPGMWGAHTELQLVLCRTRSQHGVPYCSGLGGEAYS